MIYLDICKNIKYISVVMYKDLSIGWPTFSTGCPRIALYRVMGCRRPMLHTPIQFTKHMRLLRGPPPAQQSGLSVAARRLGACAGGVGRTPRGRTHTSRFPASEPIHPLAEMCE